MPPAAMPDSRGPNACRVEGAPLIRREDAGHGAGSEIGRKIGRPADRPQAVVVEHVTGVSPVQLADLAVPPIRREARSHGYEKAYRH